MKNATKKIGKEIEIKVFSERKNINSHATNTREDHMLIGERFYRIES